MATVWIPAPMRDMTGGRQQVTAPGRTIGDLIAALEAAYPGIGERLRVGERLAPALTAIVDGRTARLGLLAPVGEASEVRFVLTVAGG